jgi:hypothetical protein
MMGRSQSLTRSIFKTRSHGRVASPADFSASRQTAAA